MREKKTGQSGILTSKRSSASRLRMSAVSNTDRSIKLRRKNGQEFDNVEIIGDIYVEY